jgi:signal transduction histidine kinase
VRRRRQLAWLVAGLVAAGALALVLGVPAADAWQLVAISFGVSAVIALVGRALLDRFRTSRLALQGLIVILVAVGATLGGALVAAQAMFVSSHDLKALLVVMVGAGTMATLAGMHLAREVDDASRSLVEVARQIGLGTTPIEDAPRNVPEELARLGAELHEMRHRLDEAGRRAQRVEQSRREVIAWVSHDLRTPIARMRAMVEAINDGVIEDQATVDRYHRAMQTEVERLGGLVDDLFELSRIQADALRLTLEPVVLAELVSDTIASARVSAEYKGVHLTGDALDPQAVAELSIPEMARVLNNLLDNAIRHSPPGGEVRVSVDSTGDDVLVSVSDQCGGIAERDIERVFDLAYSGDPARSPDETMGGSTGHDGGRVDGRANRGVDGRVGGRSAGPGAGLGLAIAKGFVEAHHGIIGVHNEGVGCTFTVSVPRWKPDRLPVP